LALPINQTCHLQCGLKSTSIFLNIDVLTFFAVENTTTQRIQCVCEGNQIFFASRQSQPR
jgi:hypothetical protein